MKTLVDLVNDDIGYARIYADQAGFGYERLAYVHPIIGDLFDRMNGYASMASAREAAEMQLLAVRAPKSRRRKK